MRIPLLVCFLLGEIHADGRASEATEIKSKAETALLEGHEKLIDAYRIQLAAAVAKADRVEVFQLDDRVTGNEKIGDPNDPFNGQSKDKWFRVDVPETPSSKITEKLLVPQEKLEPLLRIISNMLEHPGEELAACHDPVHGIRVYSGEELLFETSLCYKCLNFTMGSPIGGEYVPLPENGIKAMMLKLLPLHGKVIPAAGLELRLVVSEASSETESLSFKTSPNSGAKDDLITKKAVEFAETDLESVSMAEYAEPIPEQDGKKSNANSAAIQIVLTPEAGKKMEQLSEQNLGKRIAILVDHEIVMAPTIQTIMGRNLMISGNFTPEEAKRVIGKIQQAARK